MKLLSNKLDHVRIVHFYFSTFPIGILSVEQMVVEFFIIEVQAIQESIQFLSDKRDHAKLVQFRRRQLLSYAEFRLEF